MAGDPDFLGLGGYASSGGSGPSSSSGTSSGGSSSDEQSVDSAEARAAEAQQRLQDYGGAPAPAKTVLPSAAAAFTSVDGRPAFLDPESTRPLAVSASHGLSVMGAPAAAAGGPRHGPKGRIPAGQDFDIAKLAPALKGQQQQQDKRAPPGAVVEGKAKRYKLDDGPEATQQYTPAQIAMMGGNVEHLLAAQREGGDGGGAKRERGPATKAMGVTDFLDKGLGAAQLPRKQQDRKEKEKHKRAAGQSTHAVWKSEAEMVLRQQYD